MKVDFYDLKGNCVNTIENVNHIIGCEDGRHLITKAGNTTQVPAGYKIEVKEAMMDKPPLGVTPKEIWSENNKRERIQDLTRALYEYSHWKEDEITRELMQKWTQELQELLGG